MRFKVDENLPAALADLLREFEHEAETSPDEGLTGQEDETIWAAATASERFLITQDLDFSDARRFAPGTHPGLLLIRLHHPSRTAIIQRMREVLQTQYVESWTSCLVVVTEHKIRVRRP
jgi:predicted nuclease of predicted toxin-antitoxin system